MQRIAVAALAALSLACAGTLAVAGNTAQEEANKRIVLDLYDKALNQHDFEAASKHLGPYYKQHNPLAEDGAAGGDDGAALPGLALELGHLLLGQRLV